MRNLILIAGLCLCFSLTSQADSWEQALESKNATLNLHWYTSIPFVYHNQKGELIGLEYELMEAFGQYLRNEHQINVALNWKEDISFFNILKRIKNTAAPNDLGVSAFSITEERKTYLQYTDSYLPDITVLVSSQGTPIVRQLEDVNQLMENMAAITIKGTIYETFLIEMREDLNISFEIQYIESDENVLDHISRSDRMFGFIDLPIYLMWIKEGKDLTRQNFFTVRGIGYGFILSPSSDWNIPFNAFLANPKYKTKIADIMSKYLGSELYQFIDNSYDREQLGTYILTKEKEIQLALIRNANLKLEEEENFKRILILGIGISLVFLFIILYLFYHNQKTTKLIIDQKDQIESQQKDIRQKNEQLINRNAQLVTLNEDKNNLVNILAHDLRSPLSHILGLSSIMTSNLKDISDENKDYLDKIGNAAKHMNQMIEKILNTDSLDSGHKMILKEQVNVDQLIDDLSTRYNTLATNKDIQLSVIKPQPSLTIETDHMLLYLILENLISNAVKFSPPYTKITLEIEQSKDKTHFKITDQGPGFSEEDKLLVFNRFQKLSARPTGNESSTGLGLSIVKKYTKDLGGHVWLDSTSEKGSTFIVSLDS
ncbi:ATP-binding protein [Reichenbachiella carrageenanivorans]|uniref:histidine kinase n=1 Tax=Reichenbachiella carrageenanivorans TaxID=2979869 RepID=A0ABY6D6S7_9BACT|nr:ATP-binding protein [Reichenbachiella carrageenanivorans]UXX79535.1 ATP-binding protein [Reichenbachiella carrageenanivorans]